jgi:hypothetical protein
MPCSATELRVVFMPSMRSALTVTSGPGVPLRRTRAPVESQRNELTPSVA